MKTLIDLKSERRVKAKRDGGSIKKGFELYQDFVDLNREAFETWLNPRYLCPGCGRYAHETDATVKNWEKESDSKYPVCGSCAKRMERENINFIKELEG